MKSYYLDFKWTVSRGYNTYGYNICSLYANNQKVASCNGGGYDMKGTSFGIWMQNEFQEQLKTLFAQDIKDLQAKELEKYKSRSNGKKEVFYRYASCKGFYGAHVHEEKTVILKTGEEISKIEIQLDGGCGFDSIRQIGEAIGLKLEWNPISDRYKNNDFYTARFQELETVA